MNAESASLSPIDGTHSPSKEKKLSESEEGWHINPLGHSKLRTVQSWNNGEFGGGFADANISKVSAVGSLASGGVGASTGAAVTAA